MATQVQFRGGTTPQNDAFTGAEREVTVDTGKQTLVVHNGTEEGGFPLLRAEDGAQDFSTTGDVSAVDGTFTGDISAVDGTFTGATTLTGDLTINTDAFFVDASEKDVGIGTITPLSNLHVRDTSNVGNGTARIGGNSAPLGLLFDYDQSDDTLAKITANPTYTSGGTHGGAKLHICVDGDANADQLVLNQAGNVGIGTSSPGSLLDVNGAAEFAGVISADAGIDFSGISSTADSGTVDNNLLDDYEEGTFTPVFDTFDSASTVSHSSQTGRYTKIGDTVHYYLKVLCTVSAWGNGEWKVAGLPFDCWTTYNNPPVQSSKLSWREAGGTTVYKYQDVDYRPEHWWNRNQIFFVDTSTDGDWRPTTATDLQWINITMMGTYFVN